MADDGLRTIFIGLILFVLFSFMILSVAVDFGNEYGRDSDEIGGGSLSAIKFQESAETVNTSASSYSARFSNGEINNVDDASGLFSIITDMYNMITAPFRLLSEVVTNIFPVPTLFVNVVLGLLVISLLFLTWRVIRIGD